MTAHATNVTGWLFVSAAVMTWLGWVLTPERIGTFFSPEDFARVHRRFHTWIWLFRFHLFGHIVAVMAVVALGVLFSETDSRILVWPGIAVCSTWLLVGALAQAFHYHFGAWGALGMAGKTPGETSRFVSSLQVTTEYVTCLLRFGPFSSGSDSSCWPRDPGNRAWYCRGSCWRRHSWASPRWP